MRSWGRSARHNFMLLKSNYLSVSPPCPQRLLLGKSCIDSSRRYARIIATLCDLHPPRNLEDAVYLMLEPGASLSICPESCLGHQEIISEQSTPAQAMHNTHSGKLDEVIPSSSSSITSMTKSRLISLVIFSVMFLFAVLVGYQRRQHMPRA